MWRILQAQTPGEYVLATNETHTVREFTELAFARLGMEIEWVGKEENEKGICKKTGKILVEVNPRYYRPTGFPPRRPFKSQEGTRLGTQDYI